jgi:hypothetical protein
VAAASGGGAKQLLEVTELLNAADEDILRMALVRHPILLPRF